MTCTEESDTGHILDQTFAHACQLPTDRRETIDCAIVQDPLRSYHDVAHRVKLDLIG